MRISTLALALTVAAAACSSGRPATLSPASGRDVLERMHRMYEGRWYRTMAFVQRTTFIREGGVRDTSTWYESILGADQIRIDIGDPAAGRGLIFTAESTFAFRNGALTRAGNEGNPFLPVIQGVYLQPIDVTVRQLAHHHVDVSKVYATTWEGRPVYVVGAASADDTTSAQFWVEAERLIALRMIMPTAPGRPVTDIRLKDWVPIGRAWWSTTIDILQNGQPVQLEWYEAWSPSVPLPEVMFNRQRLISEGHWASQPRMPPAWTVRTAP